MWLLELLSDLLGDLGNIPSYEKTRRVFSWGFVAFCVLVAVLELMTLSHFMGGPGK